MAEQIKKIITPFKVMFGIGVILVTTLYAVHVHQHNNREDLLKTTTLKNNPPLHNMCKILDCTYVNNSGAVYEYTDDGLVASTLEVNSLYYSFVYERYNIAGTGVTIYTLSWPRLLSMLLIYLIPLIVVLVTVSMRGIVDKLVSVGAVRERISRDDLKLSNSVKISLATSAYHEMLTPIAVMKAIVGKIKQTTATADDMQQLCLTVSRLESVLASISGDRVYGQFDKMPINTILETTIETLSTAHIEFNFDYVIHDNHTLTDIHPRDIDTGSVSNIFNNLFKNSIEAGATKLTITPTEISDDTLTILIIDNGTGIPKDIPLESIFVNGYSTKDKTNPKDDIFLSRGNGLYLVKTILTSAGGEIFLDRTDVSGTMFVLKIPITHNKEHVNEHNHSVSK